MSQFKMIGVFMVEKVTIKRLIRAPLAMVWQAWTDPRLVKQWWGPADYTAPSIQIDLQKGGRYLYCMRTPDGIDLWSTGVFTEVVPLKRIVNSDSFADSRGNPVPSAYYNLNEDWSVERRVITTFENKGGDTKLTIVSTADGFNREDKKNMELGWNQSIDKLETLIKED